MNWFRALGLVVSTAAFANPVIFEGQGFTPEGNPISLEASIALKGSMRGDATVESTHEDWDPDTSVDPEYHCYTSLRIPVGVAEVALAGPSGQTIRTSGVAEIVVHAQQHYDTPTPCQETDLSGSQDMYFTVDMPLHPVIAQAAGRPVNLNLSFLLSSRVRAELTRSGRQYSVAKLDASALLDRSMVSLPMMVDVGFLKQLGSLDVYRQ